MLELVFARWFRLMSYRGQQAGSSLEAFRETVSRWCGDGNESVLTNADRLQ